VQKKGRFSLEQIVRLSSTTLLSRLLGFVREMLIIRSFGGARALSDAFVTAFRIPNLIYELCVNGALGPAVLPTLIYEKKQHGDLQLQRLMTLLFILISGGMFFLSLLIMAHAPAVIRLVAPGFLDEQACIATALLRILIGSLSLNATIALITEALRTTHHFTIPAFGQVLINIVSIAGLIAYHYYQFPVTYLAVIMLFAIFLSLCMHGIAYHAHHFSLRRPNQQSWKAVSHISRRIMPVMVSVGIVQLNSFIDLQFASYLAVGSVSLLNYSSSFINLPLGIFNHACITVIFPDLVRLAHYAPRRLGYIIYETIKVTTWLLLPIAAAFVYFSYDIFNTFYGLTYFSAAQLSTAQWLLIIKAGALCSLAVNQILLAMFHALNETTVPGMVSLISLCTSIVLNCIAIKPFGIYGIALTGTIVATLRTMVLLGLAHKRLQLGAYAPHYIRFLGRVIIQLCAIGIPGIASIAAIRTLFAQQHTPLFHWLSASWGLWCWVIPLSLCIAYLLYATRRLFSVKLYLLDRVR